MADMMFGHRQSSPAPPFKSGLAQTAMVDHSLGSPAPPFKGGLMQPAMSRNAKRRMRARRTAILKSKELTGGLLETMWGSMTWPSGFAHACVPDVYETCQNWYDSGDVAPFASSANPNNDGKNRSGHP